MRYTTIYYEVVVLFEANWAVCIFLTSSCTRKCMIPYVYSPSSSVRETHQGRYWTVALSRDMPTVS